MYFDEIKITKKYESLCDTCAERQVCGSESGELISPDDIERLEEMGIEAIAVVFKCKGYKFGVPSN